MKIILHNKPTLGKEEAGAVKKVIQSNWLIAGKEVEKLQDRIKRLLDVKYAIATNSGTSALHLSLIALGIKAKDEVILPTYTASDILNAIFYTGATPVLVDIERNGFNIDFTQIEKKIGKKTKALLIPHMFGFPAKVDQLKKYRIPIIEDCAQAIGSTYQEKPVGSFGDISIFSFYATKIIATGQGGMVTTNNKEYYIEMKDLINYNGRDNYKVRYNYPMTDIAASIGNVQFEKLNSFIERRKYIASCYINVLEKKNISYWPKRQNSNVNHFRFVIQLDSTARRDRVRKQFFKKGILTIVPISHFELLHVLLKQNKHNFPKAENLTNTSLSLPIYPSLTDAGVERVIEALDVLL